jgi:hypothetical protein
MPLRSLYKLLVCLPLLVCTSVFAAPLVVDVTGIQSFAATGSSANTTFAFNVGAGATITNVSFNVNLTAFAPSALSDMGLLFSDSAQSDVTYFTPGVKDIDPGTATYAGSADLVDLDLDVVVGADGILYLEFYEAFNDAAVSPDGIWNFGTITFGFLEDDVPPAGPGTVPEPASTLLLGAGLAAMGYTGRRRACGQAAA